MTNNVATLKLSRKQLQEVFKNPVVVRGFEDNINAVNALIATNITSATADSSPQSIGSLTLHAASNTSLIIRLMGSDGFVRSATLVLA
jgi:hypothetical protein